MKYICETDFEINGIPIGTKGDILEVTNAVPSKGQTAESVIGYCDIVNTNTNKRYEATWMDISDELKPVE